MSSGVLSPEKSPACCAAVGTVADVVIPARFRRPGGKSEDPGEKPAGSSKDPVGAVNGWCSGSQRPSVAL